ncbi:hypothetical protein IRJ41_001178 [Triplophysa rosa]|uniref:Uncharacterized protein n=1 Tax=Triplophysa rosa TaxID=992332 RepID=A0A9W7T3N0_TRIRA|nr:hypothetical protein IRJ41_001178 [Triplophysa rosa]
MDSPVVCRPAEAFDIFDDHQAMLSWGDLVEDALAEASIGPLDIKLPSWAAVDPTVEARDPQHTPQPATGEETRVVLLPEGSLKSRNPLSHHLL